MTPRAGFLALVRALAWRGWRTDRTYRLYVAQRALGPLLAVAVAVFMDRLVGRPAALAAYGGSYLPFVLVGLFVVDLQSAASTGTTSTLRTEQLAGTLEAILAAAPARAERVLLAATVYELSWTLLGTCVYLVTVGVVVAGAGLRPNVAATLLSLGALAAFGAGLWLTSAAAALTLKRADPVSSVLMLATLVSGGILYPLEVMPSWLRALAQLLPATHLAETLRRAILGGAGPTAIARPLVISWAYAAVALVAGFVALRLAIARGRRGGWLGDY